MLHPPCSAATGQCVNRRPAVLLGAPEFGDPRWFGGPRRFWGPPDAHWMGDADIRMMGAGLDALESHPDLFVKQTRKGCYQVFNPCESR